MWEKINEDIWQKEQKEQNLGLLFDKMLLNHISFTFGLEINFYFYKHKGSVVSLIGFFSKNNNIILPKGLPYLSFWIDNIISEEIYFKILESLFQNVLINNKTISFKLSPQITDIRPFIWHHYKIAVKYTNTQNNFSQAQISIQRNLTKNVSDKYTCYLEDINNLSIKLNINQLKKIGIAKNHIFEYEKLFKSFLNLEFYRAFNVYSDKKLICSNIVLINQQQIFTLFLNSTDKENKYAHTFLYQFMIDWCKENGMKKIDFCGANMKSISVFKSYFSNQLETYYEVSYKPYYQLKALAKAKMISLYRKIKA